jgi:hypothetical protein
MAYEINPDLFKKVNSASDLPDILDEVKYSLDYLTKTFPDENTFVIQVANRFDHHQGWRLPENDLLDGKRPALCALSRVHMGMTSASLALGAKIFRNIDADASALYENKAIAIYERARKDDTQVSAFERDITNNFYYDPTDTDNMALAAAEIYLLTKNQKYLDDGISYAPPASRFVTWAELNAFANYRLAVCGDEKAKDRLLKQINTFEHDNAWNLPGKHYSWGSLPCWIGKANAGMLAQRLNGNEDLTTPFFGVLDYTFGCNNWGIAMVASNDLRDSIKNIYNFVWHVLKKLPVGALSEGPGDRPRHEKLKKYFDTPVNSWTEEFNTSEGVFYDNAFDFMIQESTIWGQGNLILMLALAHLSE